MVAPWLVVEAEPPLTSEKHREHLSVARLASEHVADRPCPRLPRRQPRSSGDLANHPPIILTQLLKDDVCAPAWIHASIVEAQASFPERWPRRLVSVRSDETAALKDERQPGLKQRPRHMGDRDRAFNSAERQLHETEQIALFGIVVGIALLLSGIGFIILASASHSAGANQHQP
jgi:hypothetical protein